jgi:hypothetical protein
MQVDEVTELGQMRWLEWLNLDHQNYFQLVVDCAACWTAVSNAFIATAP